MPPSNTIRASLRCEKDRQNIDIYWEYIEKFSLFWDRWEALSKIQIGDIKIGSWKLQEVLYCKSCF